MILQRQCQRMLFFSFESVREGAAGRALLVSPPHARVHSECKRWNLEHVVLDLFSHFTLVRFSGCLMVVLDPFSHIERCKIQRLFVSCRGSGFCDLFQLFASFAQLFVVAVDHVRGCPRIRCWARARSSSSELVDTATARRRQRVEDATRVGLQFPFLPRTARLECTLMDHTIRACSCPAPRRAGSLGHDRCG